MAVTEHLIENGLIPNKLDLHLNNPDVLAEPWAWVSFLERTNPPRSEIENELGAPGPLVDGFRGSLLTIYGDIFEGKHCFETVQFFREVAELHLTLSSQGHCSQPAVYLRKMRTLVERARLQVDERLALLIPAEHRSQFLKSRNVSTRLPASAARLLQQLMQWEINCEKKTMKVKVFSAHPRFPTHLIFPMHRLLQTIFLPHRFLLHRLSNAAKNVRISDIAR